MNEQARVEPPKKGTVDALEHTMSEFGIENMVAQSRPLADNERFWNVVFVTDDAGCWTGEGNSMAEASRDALKKLSSYRKSL